MAGVEVGEQHPGAAAGALRLRHVDALRGIAALLVVSHHLLHTTVLEVPLREALPRVVTWTQTFGAHGVEVFFVISGFVITLSLRSTAIGWRDKAQFILRRQVRLDLPYWATIGLVLLLSAVEGALGLVVVSHPSFFGLLANAFYLQGILQVDEIVIVAWTLCLEVQFYLFLLFLISVAQGIENRRGRGPASNVGDLLGLLTAAVFLTGVGSLVVAWTADVYVLTAWFVGFWHLFAMGALLYLALYARVPFAAALLVVLLVLEVATFVVQPGLVERPSIAAGLAAAAFLGACRFSAGFARPFATWRPLLYLGSRSYSIYLIHLSVLTIVMRLGYKVTGDRPWAAVGWMVLAFAASIGAGELLYCTVERRSVLLSKQIRQTGARATAELVWSAVEHTWGRVRMAVGRG